MVSSFSQSLQPAGQGADSTDSLLAWLTLAITPGIGPITCRRLLDAMGTPENVLTARPGMLAELPGLKRPIKEAIAKGWDTKAAIRELESCRRLGITLIPWDSPRYPEILRHIADPPIMLYLRGDADILAGAGVAVVGARAASPYGLQMAERFARELAEAGLVVTSGLALGVDAAAHQGALTAQGKTVAVLGCGLNVTYPRENHRLFTQIATTGALLTEYPLGTPPDSFRFPARNRIISGLSLGVLVIEAAQQSGSLITARLALEQGREVFAMPGRIDSVKSTGTNRLLQQGAKLVSSVEDILEELRLPLRHSVSSVAPMVSRVQLASRSPEELVVLNVIDAYGLEIDEIIRQSGLTASRVGQLLLGLELEGAVEPLPGGRFRKKEIC